MTRIAFYAPLKPPGHPIPSGDREIARNLLKALALAGFDPFVASEAIAYQKRPSAALFLDRKARCEAETERLLAAWRTEPALRPDVWMTYHPYCKAPDWIGPPLCRALDIPYVTVEACRTRQDTDTDWADGRAVVQAAVRQAVANFCLKPADRAYLESVLPDASTILPLKPFTDLADLPDAAVPQDTGADGDGPLILAVGMMRPGAKIESYRLLAEAMSGLLDRPWRLTIVGDGPGRSEVEAMFALAGNRVRFTGALPHPEVLGWIQRADLFAWPGVREAFGVAYLEAQANGLPVAAFATTGVPVVVAHGESGLLAPEFDVAAYRGNLARLLSSPEDRARLGAGGRAKVMREHGLEAAAMALKTVLSPLLATRPAQDGTA
ncbi:glycosyltransferase family 4 protein [Aquibium microcysteis]|uniref:glycosyltransferase family 4 protein n=1 Tax=Aquibium microcysteis TaxID=675281 RepID=UPI00165D208B|nr:glycosyltransferase family 4 protein [Aquibium microcysteis]